MSNENNAIGGEYESFEQLFNDAANNMDAIKDTIKPATKQFDLAIFRIEFNTWLIDKCSWNGERNTYVRFLTRDFFIRFVQYKTEQENESIAALEQERHKWNVSKSEFTTQQELTNKYVSKQLTQRQKAIVLYFKEKAGVIPYQERHGLKEQENGSLALYNALCQVRNGNYKIDDLEAAIEFLIEFPTAHKLATEAFEKS